MSRPRRGEREAPAEGWRGWDEYAPFYDWENARTVGRRDVPFWQRLAASQEGRVLELGCGTGRITLPVARAGAHVVGIDRSDAMLARNRQRIRRARLGAAVSLVRGDIRHLPFRRRTGFSLVMAPYGILQSLTRERDLRDTLVSVRSVLASGGMLGVDLVPDLPKWDEYQRRTSLTGTARGARITLVESVRQDVARRLTIFDQEYVVRRGADRRTHRFSLTFRTLSVRQMVRRLEAAGFEVRAVLGDYDGGPWDPRSDVWVILAARR
ncbi:MAG TPA: class I SAM-dependent methyltransferase [Vicinamibacterales bacterium]|nr:class I SAM-dependent methyltransferase [Vicinamibacterales bacterium]